ncbi:MAG: Stp1/IreP family PP2C-type Ser/Thr phosphatase [Deltaproteobacteria bacterium]|nr:MAG: Stp1/IreP family PP2C-type Ser/Thr phosphatase [Deltaproteobacteria bacterium]
MNDRLDPIETASRSDVGYVRAENEDSFGEFDREPGEHLLVVADGMGGHQGGATASRLAVETIGRVFAESADVPEAMLQRAFEAANREVLERAGRTPELLGMGTTCVALWLGPGAEGWVAHVGDSRAYRLRSGALEALTLDHTVVAEFERRGFLTAEEARVHPRRNELLRSIGVDRAIEVDLAPISIEPGDRFLLCSDGLCGVVDADAIRDALAEAPPPTCAQQLVDLAKRAGAPDNVTVQVACVGGA